MTCTRKQGIECFLGFYDIHADVLGGVFRTRKRIVEVSEAFRRLLAGLVWPVLGGARSAPAADRFRVRA